MKKFLVGILAGIFCFGSAFAMTGCDVTAALDLAFENECLIAENEELAEKVVDLTEKVEDLEVEVATLKFEAAFEDRIVGGENVVELVKTALKVNEGAGDALTVIDKATVTINGGSYNGGQTPFGGAGNTAVWVNSIDAKVIINDGVFTISGLAVNEDGVKDTGHIDLIYCSAGTIEINGGWFEGADSDVWLLNCKDAAYKDGTAKIVVKGGTFVNFDPSNCVSEGEGTSFVPEGYVVVKETREGIDYYTVVKASVDSGEEEVESEVPVEGEESAE